MDARLVWSRVLIVVGLAAMLVGAVDPLEGSFIILPGIGLVTVGAIASKSRYARLLFRASGAVAFGVAMMVVFTWAGGIGGNSGHSIWSAALIFPYPVGWLIGVVGAVLAMLESRKRYRLQRFGR